MAEMYVNLQTKNINFSEPVDNFLVFFKIADLKITLIYNFLIVWFFSNMY